MPNRRQCHWNSRQGHRCTFTLRGKVSETLPMPQTENATRLFLIVSECHRRSASPPPPQCQIVPPPTCTPARPPPPPSRPPRRITIAHQQECQHISYKYTMETLHTHTNTHYTPYPTAHTTRPLPLPLTRTHARTHEARGQRQAGGRRTRRGGPPRRKRGSWRAAVRQQRHRRPKQRARWRASAEGVRE